MARHAQIIRNKFPISLQYLKKELSGKVDFLLTDKHERLLQIDSMTLMAGWSSILKVPNIVRVSNVFTISQKRN